MNSKVKSYLAVAIGVVAGAATIFIFEMLSPYQPPADLDTNNKAAIGEYVKNMPIAAFLLVMLGYFFGALLGGMAANYFCRDTKYRPAMVVAAGLCIFGMMNFFQFPHPVWFMIVSSLVYFVGGWLAGKVSARI